MEALGIDIKLLLAQIINFIILLLILKKFLYSPVISMLEERKKKIKAGIENFELAKEKISSTEGEIKDKIEKAEAKANKIISESKASASEKATEIIKKANDQADKILSNAQLEASQAKEEVLLEAKNELGQIVITALEKIIDEELSATEKEKLAKKALSEI